MLGMLISGYPKETRDRKEIIITPKLTFNLLRIKKTIAIIRTHIKTANNLPINIDGPKILNRKASI